LCGAVFIKPITPILQHSIRTIFRKFEEHLEPQKLIEAPQEVEYGTVFSATWIEPVTLDVEQVAKWAREHGLRVARIIHSGKKRALQTAEIFAAALKPEGGVVVQEGLKPLDDPAVFAATIADTDNLLVVGHLPFMEKLVAYLVTGSMEPLVLKCINGGIVCLDREPINGHWCIKWTIVPRLE
jgi:phosphohistidine phosphatase